jgi:hypothetical protein
VTDTGDLLEHLGVFIKGQRMIDALIHCPRVRNGARRNMLFIDPALTAGFKRKLIKHLTTIKRDAVQVNRTCGELCSSNDRTELRSNKP